MRRGSALGSQVPQYQVPMNNEHLVPNYQSQDPKCFIQRRQ